jgi:hypothetical protein
MNSESQKKEHLKELLAINPIGFINECLAESKNGLMPEICQYVQLKILNERGEFLTEEEKEILNIIHPKYNDLKIDHLEEINQRIKTFANIDDVKIELRKNAIEIRDEIKSSLQNSGNKNHAAFLEFVTALATNIRTDKKLRYKYNFKNNQELFDCFQNYKTRNFKLSEDVTIKLKPGPFIHILLGHIEKYQMHRKGYMVRFSQINNWEELLILITDLITFLKDELIQHFSISNQKYDNNCFTYQKKLYGIHLDKKGEIKTLYERKNEC